MNKLFALIAMVWLLPLTALAGLPEQLPADLVWETNTADPEYGDPNAQRGGIYRTFIPSFPATLRVVGPNSNGAFRSAILSNAFGVVGTHPDTRRAIPQLATHWAYGDDGKTVFYKLDPDARWSDGVPVTADDYTFVIEFMRSPHIFAPWYNNYYTEMIVDVRKYDRYIIGIEGGTVRTRDEIHQHYGIAPLPRHFHKLDENWVREYNWKTPPLTGPYHISRIRKGKYLEFSRVENWWGDNKPYHRGRFNVDKVIFKVIRDPNTAYQYFSKGELDDFGLVQPSYWYKKARGKFYDRGYIAKYKFYNDVPRPAYGVYLNQADPILADRNVRYAIAHAMNVQKVIDTVLHGDYERLQTINEGYGEFTNHNIRARRFDPDKARQLLREAGWEAMGDDGILTKDGERLSLRINYSASHHTDRLVILAEEARRAGIEFKLQLLDSTTSFKQILEKKHQLAWMGWGTVGFSPTYYSQYHSDGANKPQTNNITNTDNPEFDKRIEEYRTTSDHDRRVQLAHELEQLIYDEGASIPTFKIPYIRGAYWRWLRLPAHRGTRSSDNSLFSPFGDSGGLFWIDPDMQRRIESARDDGAELSAPVNWVDDRWKQN